MESTVQEAGVPPALAGKNWQLNVAACSGKVSPDKSSIAVAIVRIAWSPFGLQNPSLINSFTTIGR